MTQQLLFCYKKIDDGRFSDLPRQFFSYFLNGIWGKRSDVLSDGNRLPSLVDTCNIRGVTSCVAGFCGMGRAMGEGLGYGLPVNFQMV